ncbi:hypothetical protein HPF57_1079 [Helicobacter pylori F57]|nr:hypothetical protein HPF57_1079 [Helicobacter pylori F57]
MSRLNIPLVLTNIYKFQTIASGFYKLFKNDFKIAESLKPAATKNLSQGLATTLKGALKYQWTKSTLGLYSATRPIAGVKLNPKRSRSASEFSKNLRALTFTISCIIF